MNHKPKTEQFFLLLLMSIGAFALFCMAAGCGSNSCETISCGSDCDDGYKTASISIPGCGGCLTSGRGCNSCLWPQSCKISAGCWDGTENDGESTEGSNEDSYEDTMEGSTEDTNTAQGNSAKIIGCDNRYYGNSCLGCQSENSCYTGFGDLTEGDDHLTGIFYGQNDNETEKMIGCYNGCIGCVGSNGTARDTLRLLEYQLDIE